MDEDQVARLHRWQRTRLQQFGIVAREHVARLAQRAGEHHRLEWRVVRRLPHVDAMERAVHGRPHQVAEPGIDHDESVSRPLGIGMGALDVRHPRHQRGDGRHEVAPRLDFHPDICPRLLAETRLALTQQVTERFEVNGRRFRLVGVGQTAAEADGLRVRIGGQTIGEEIDELLHAGLEFLGGWPGAYVGVQQRHRHALPRGVLGRRQRRVRPQAVLGTGAARVAALHVSVPEARVEAQGNGAAITGVGELPHHGRRAEVGQHLVLADDLQGVVPEHVGGQHDLRYVGAHGIARRPRPQDFIPRYRVDPYPLLAHGAQHLCHRARLHGVTRLQARCVRQVADGGDAGA